MRVDWLLLKRTGPARGLSSSNEAFLTDTFHRPFFASSSFLLPSPWCPARVSIVAAFQTSFSVRLVRISRNSVPGMAPTRNSKRFFDFSSFPNFYAFWCGTSYIIIVRKLTCFYKMYFFSFFAFGFDSPTPSQNIRATTWNCEIWKRRNRLNPSPNGEPLWVDHDCMITFPPAHWPLTGDHWWFDPRRQQSHVEVERKASLPSLWKKADLSGRGSSDVATASDSLPFLFSP